MKVRLWKFEEDCLKTVGGDTMVATDQAETNFLTFPDKFSKISWLF